MLRTLLSSSAVFAAPTAAEGAPAKPAVKNTPAASRKRQSETVAESGQTETGPRAVYLRPEKTAADIIVRLESYAEAGLRFLSSIVVHMIVRTYSTIDADRVKDIKTLMAEIEGYIQEYAKGKRGGKAFEHAWTSRILSTARTMCQKIIKDAGGVSRGEMGDILRSKSVDTANEVVFQHCLRITKGSNSFTALTKMLGGGVAKPAKGGKEAKTSNATVAVKGTNAAVAKRVLSDNGFEVLNAIPGKAVAKATKLADTIAKSNVDHRTFVLRALTMIDKPEVLLEIAEEATRLAKAMSAANRKGAKETGEAAAA